MRWDEMRWDEMRWDEMRWDEMRWDEMRWDEMRWDEREKPWEMGETMRDFLENLSSIGIRGIVKIGSPHIWVIENLLYPLATLSLV